MKKLIRGRLICGGAMIAAAATFTGCACCKDKPVTRAATNQHGAKAMLAEQTVAPSEEVRFSIVGPQGTDGPAGQVGAQGERGQTGDAGYVVAGERGVAGPAGIAGERGPTGASGPEGALKTGATGIRGVTGPSGAQGSEGVSGARGSSVSGIAGPAGPAGIQGRQGPVGPTGERGQTLTGPSGPAGRSGVAGQQGQTGQTGYQGATAHGNAGPPGVAGPAGIQGPVGLIGSQGITGVVKQWTPYREFWFEFDRAEIHSADRGKVAEIAAYMKMNPSIRVGLDGTKNPSGSDPNDMALENNRVDAVRNALISAGVSKDQISTGALGDPNTRRDRRVEVLIRSYQVSQAN